MEQYFISSGLIIPTFHKFYWIGLSVSGLWPNFTWVDRSPGPSEANYEHWGRYISTGNEPEPNNFDYPPENCAGANYTESFGNPGAWGWADWGCDQAFTFMCKISSEPRVGWVHRAADAFAAAHASGMHAAQPSCTAKLSTRPCCTRRACVGLLRGAAAALHLHHQHHGGHLAGG